MRNILICTLVCLALVGCDKVGSKEKDTYEISGQVFVVTKGRENIKLALVDVNIYPENVILDHIKTKKKIASEQQTLLQRNYDETQNEYLSAQAKADAVGKELDRLFRKGAEEGTREINERIEKTMDLQMSATENAASKEAVFRTYP